MRPEDLTYATLAPETDPAAVGDLRVWRDVELTGLGRSADIHVWLPAGYDDPANAAVRYPVAYLHDGGNLFLPATAFDGVHTWRASEAAEELGRGGLDVVVVGIPCSPTDRIGEYTQYPHPEHGGGRAAAYARMIADDLKPAIDRVLRTEPGPRHTVTAGSSLGGVVSAYLWETRPEVFGGAGLFSTAFWFPGERAVADLAAAARRVRDEGRDAGRVYLDVGGSEGDEGPEVRRRYVADTEAALAALRDAGVPTYYVYDSTAAHREAAWAERLPNALRWLLRGWDR